jgi:hypothetical protein
MDKTIAGQGFCSVWKSSKRKYRLAKSYQNESFATKSFADVALTINSLATRKMRGTDCRVARLGLGFTEEKNQNQIRF